MSKRKSLDSDEKEGKFCDKHVYALLHLGLPGMTRGRCEEIWKLIVKKNLAAEDHFVDTPTFFVEWAVSFGKSVTKYARGDPWSGKWMTDVGRLLSRWSDREIEVETGYYIGKRGMHVCYKKLTSGSGLREDSWDGNDWWTKKLDTEALEFEAHLIDKCTDYADGLDDYKYHCDDYDY